MGCIQVPAESCPDCFDREIDCQCGCPDGGLDPNGETCKCKDTTCAAPKVPRLLEGEVTCQCACPPLDCDAVLGLVINETTCECSCPPNSGKVQNEEGFCVCPPNKIDDNGVCVECPVATHEVCNGVCLPKCENGQERQPNATPPNCDCNCPPNKLEENGNCVPCPVDANGVAGTHDLCNNVCLPKCTEGKVRAANDCLCYCPPGTVYAPTDPQDPNAGGSCAQVKYSCIDGSCVADVSGTYETLTLCNQNCGGSAAQPCSPIPDPPIGLPILCADGVTQIGITLHPTFDPETCSWPGVPVYFGNSCPGSSSGSGGSSPPLPECCSKADPGGPQFKFLCNALVPTKATNYTAPCAGHYTTYTWCDTCFNGMPLLRRVDTYEFNANTCKFELFLATPDIQSCPPSESGTSSASGGDNNGSSSNNSSSTTPSLSSGSSSSGANSSGSSSSSRSSGCTPEPVSILYSVASNGAPLNQFGPGATANVTVTVSDLGAAVRSGVSWSLKANGVVLFGFTVAITDPNPRTFTISAESLLASVGLSFETAAPGSYAFGFCGEAVNCANTSVVQCTGSITVVVPVQSSSSGGEGSSGSSAIGSSSGGGGGSSTSSASDNNLPVNQCGHCNFIWTGTTWDYVQPPPVEVTGSSASSGSSFPCGVDSQTCTGAQCPYCKCVPPAVPGTYVGETQQTNCAAGCGLGYDCLNDCKLSVIPDVGYPAFGVTSCSGLTAPNCDFSEYPAFGRYYLDCAECRAAICPASSSSSSGASLSPNSSTSSGALSQSSSSSCAAPPACACYMTVIPENGCPEYICLPDNECCAGVFGPSFDGGNAANTCDTTIDLGNAAQIGGCLPCTAGPCGQV